MKLVYDIYPMMMQYISFRAYYPILASCKTLYMYRAYLKYYMDDIRTDERLLRKWAKIYNSTDVDADVDTKSLLCWAAYTGILPLINILSDNMDKCDILYWAAVGGQEYVLDYFYDGRTDDLNIMDISALHGHVNIVKFLRHRGESCSISTMCNAVRGGYIECIQYIYEYSGILLTPYSLTQAENLECFIYIYDIVDIPWHTLVGLITACCNYNYIENIRYLYIVECEEVRKLIVKTMCKCRCCDDVINYVREPL